MADSKVMAVSIGFALAGIAVLAGLAGYTIENANGPEPDLLEPTAVPQSPALGQAGATQADREESPTHSRSASASEPRPRATAAPVPVPTPLAAQPEAPPAPEIDRSGSFAPIAVGGDIYSVDFRDGFTYPLAGVGPLELSDGRAANRPDGDPLDFVIDEVVYGDVTGDGNDDAVIVIHFTDQWDEQVSLARLFSIENDMLTDWGSTWADYGSRGGITSIDLAVPGTIRIESTNQQQTRQFGTVWAVQGVNAGLTRMETQMDRPLIAVSSTTSQEPIEIDADWRGAVRAVVSTDGTSAATVAFTAESGWMVDVANSRGAAAHLRVWAHPTGQLIGDAVPGTPLQLAGDGRYVGQILNETPTVFDLEVADQRTMLAPTWTPRSAVEVVEVPGRRSVSLAWPEFTSASGAADLTAVNATIQAFVEDRRQRNQVQVDATCDQDERSMFALSYHLTLVSYDLVSIDFNEFVCLCEHGDSWETHVLTIDMNTGQRLDVVPDAGAQAVSFADLWWNQTVEQNYFDETLLHSGNRFVEIETVSVTPYGLTITAESTNGTEQLPSYANTMLSFDDLEGLIDPAIVQRARSGAAVAIPIQEGCGC